MKYILLMVGITCTILGFVGVVVPLLPTTPFLLLAAICFAKSSERFKNWLIHTKVYREYVESFKNERGYTLIKKFKLFNQFIYRYRIFNLYDRSHDDSSDVTHHGVFSNNLFIYICKNVT